MMIKFDDAFKLAMDLAYPVGVERVSIDRALNRVLAEDVVSDVDMPPFNKSAMDGFAVRRADLANELTIIETIPAGYVPKKTIEQNQCARVTTGAIVPQGADCVIMVEHTRNTSENKIRFIADYTDDNICWKGEDVKKGDVVLRVGQIIKPQHIAMLASCGCIKPLVTLRPKVGIIATGNEIVEPDKKPSPGQIRNSNGMQLFAQVTDMGVPAKYYGIAGDTEEAINAMVKKALVENKVVIISGGMSVGDYDFVREVLKKNNVELLFEKIAVKPGRPTAFGIKKLTSNDVVSYLADMHYQSYNIQNTMDKNQNTRFVFGLPGNPVSSFVMFELLVKPFLFKLMGHDFAPVLSLATLEKTITRKKLEREWWLPVVFSENGKVSPVEYHGSAHINALCEADGLLCMPTGIAEIKKGTIVAIRQI